MVFYPKQGSSKDLIKGKTLLIPSVSLANLPQLTIDLIIHSLNLTLHGYVGIGDTVAPLIGKGQGGLRTGGLEVYTNDETDIVVVQQRSPVLKTKKDQHVDLIRRFILETQPRFTILLTSLDAANQDDQALLTPFVSILPLDPSPHTPPNLLSLPKYPTDSYPPYIPSGGLSRKILDSLSHSSPSVDHAAIGGWCVEGDNRQDALGFARLVFHILCKSSNIIHPPPDWDGLFGCEDGWGGGEGSNAEIYG